MHINKLTQPKKEPEPVKKPPKSAKPQGHVHPNNYEFPGLSEKQNIMIKQFEEWQKTQKQSNQERTQTLGLDRNSALKKPQSAINLHDIQNKTKREFEIKNLAKAPLKSKEFSLANGQLMYNRDLTHDTSLIMPITHKEEPEETDQDSK